MPPASSTKTKPQAKPDANLGEVAMAELLGECDFLGRFCALRRRTTDAPLIYHAIAGLAAVAAALGNRVRCEGFGGAAILPHLWLCFVAPSGFFHKSSAIAGATRLIVAAGAEHLLLPQDFTQEGLVVDLGEQPHGILVTDELSRLLEMLEKRYNLSAKQFLTEIYDAGPYRTSRSGSKRKPLRDVALSILAASTRHWLQASLQPSDFATGFLSRMLFIPGRVLEPEPAFGAWGDLGPETAVLATLYQHLLTLEGTVDFSPVAGALTAWSRELRQEWNEQTTPDEFHGLVSRAPVFAQKVAMSLQAAATVERGVWSVVEPETWERAARFTRWAIREQMRLLSQDFAFTQFGQRRQRLLDFLRSGEWQSRTAVVRHMDIDGRDLATLLASCREGGYIEERQEQTGGRPLLEYRLMDHTALQKT